MLEYKNVLCSMEEHVIRSLHEKAWRMYSYFRFCQIYVGFFSEKSPIWLGIRCKNYNVFYWKTGLFFN